MMTFREQLALTVLDKGLLAAVLVLLGFLANRASESFRARQTLQTEIAKKRVEQISFVWAKLSDFETQVFHVPWRIGAFLLQELQASGAHELPTRPPDTANGLGELFRQYGARAMTPDARRRFDATIGPLLVRAHETSITTSEFVSGHRFWLGPQLHKEYRDHYDRILDVLRHVDLATHDGTHLEQALRDLEQSREDISTLLAKL